MPKESPKKAPRSPAKSPRKTKQPRPGPTDESTWRQSSIRPGTKINKSSALSLYRLKEADLAGLQREESQTVVTINRQRVVKPMYLYNERDVEKQAWKKQGSPEAFEAYLRTLKERFYAKPTNRGKQFPAPDAYSEPTVCIVSLPRAPRLLDPDDEWVVTPGLHALKPQFPRWLWRACNEQLDRVGDDAADWCPVRRVISHPQREKAMRAALTTLAPRYPPRPDAPLPSSPAVDRFRAVLERAPKGPDDEGMERWDDGPSQVTTFYWNDSFLEELFEALIAVLEAHGIEGWESVRWEVYDKYSSCLGGITYEEREVLWFDHAFAWLCGRLQHRQHYLSTRRCEHSEAGRRYNSMLPDLPIGRDVL